MFKGFKNVNIVTPNGVIKSNLEIKAGKITSLSCDESFMGLEFNEEVYVVPGFIDEHIHGLNGSDSMDGNIEALQTIASSLVKEGTTSFLATTMTQSKENIINALINIKEYILHHNISGAEMLGVHLEGPFINKEACGAQPKDFIVNPSVTQFEEYLAASGNTIKLVTIAPEMSGSIELIRYCKDHDIVPSIGHTKAGYEDVVQAIENGASSVTHCFNAMTGLHHRDVGVVGATFLSQELNAELVADGIHVHKKAIELLYKNKGKDNITLVTDSMRAKNLPNGLSELGGQKVIVKDGMATLEDGTIAGSVLRMSDAFKNMITFLNILIEDAVKMTSTNPAKKLGVYDRKGSIEGGKDADLVVMDKNFSVLMTVCIGEIEYNKGVNNGN